MTGDEVRQVCEAMLPQDESNRPCQQCGVIERQRTLFAHISRPYALMTDTPNTIS